MTSSTPKPEKSSIQGQKPKRDRVNVERRSGVGFGRSPKKVSITFEEPTRTQQHFKAECDIRNIVGSNNKTQMLDKLYPLQFEGVADSIDPNDFHASMDIISNAQQQFELLPSKLRDRFGNSPVAYLEFMENPENIPEMERMKLFSPEAMERVKNARIERKKARKASQENPLESPPGGQPEGAETPSKSKKRQ